MPDLAIEIKSPDDTLTELVEKATYYLNHGSQIVWIVLPEKRQVDVYTKIKEGEIYKETVAQLGEISGGDVLPGLTINVKDMFDVLL